MAKTKTPETFEDRPPAPRGWPGRKVAGLPVWGWLALTAAALVVVLGAGAWWTYGRGAQVPPVRGFYGGEEVVFIHTEASDPQVAELLTGMKASPVLFVPDLAEVPPGSLGNVYVFKSGVKGAGPFGFQSDVFDSAPGDAGYSPLRAVHLVTWNDGARPHLLTSAQEVTEAADRGDLRIERAGAVVNMPFLTWPGGHR